MSRLLDHEESHGLTDGGVTAVSRDAQRVLMGIRAAAQAVSDALVAALRDRKASLAIFARFPHVERMLPLTHDLIAGSIGSSRETVTLALRELMRSGFVARVGERYRLSTRPEELA